MAGNLLLGERVYLLDYEGSRKTDRYGRRLCCVYRAPDGLFVNAELVRQGYANVYDDVGFRHLGGVRQLERFAREARKSLWGERAAAPETPAELSAEPPPVKRPPTDRTGTAAERHGLRDQDRHEVPPDRVPAPEKSQIPIELRDGKGRYGPCSACRPPSRREPTVTIENRLRASSVATSRSGTATIG